MHEFDKCIVASKNGAKLGEGFVNEFEGKVIKACLDEDFALLLTQDVNIFIFNRVKGECVYKAVVSTIDGKNVVFINATFLHSTQKRNNTRVGTALRYRITHRFIGEDFKNVEKLKTPIDINILNLSANGMYIGCSSLFVTGQKFPLVFRDAGKPINLVVEVVRCQNSHKGSTYGCRFLNISEKDADNIFRFVLHEQIEQRRRNLLF